MWGEIMNFYKNYIKDHFAAFYISLGIWIISLCIGMYVAFTIGEDSAKDVDLYIQSIINAKNSYLRVLKNGFITNLQYTFLLCASSSFFLFLPFSVMLIGFKGFAAGFTSSFIIRLYALKGVAATITGVILPLCFSLPVLFIMFVSVLEFPIGAFRLRNQISSGDRWKMYLANVAKIFVLFLLLSFITAVEAFLSPKFFKILTN